MGESTSDKACPKTHHCDFHIAGVGASAGGLEALEKLFDALPNNTKKTE